MALNLANETEAKDWKQIMEIARNSEAAVPLAREHDLAKQFERLRDQCRTTWEREHFEIFQTDGNRDESVVQPYWKASSMYHFFNQHEAEIKEWLRRPDHILHSSAQRRQR